MTTPSPDLSPLNHIESAALECLEFVANLSFDDFLRDRKTQAAVVWQICVIGEAVSRVDESVRRQAPGIDWRGMTGMRNILIHQYDNINYNLVWRTVSERLPPLITSVRRLRDGPGAGPR